MDTSVSFQSITVKRAFEQFLEGSSFARRTRESYAEALKPLLAQVGQAPISALTDEVARSFLVSEAPHSSGRPLLDVGYLAAHRHRAKSEAIYILDGLLKNESDIKPEEVALTQAMNELVSEGHRIDPEVVAFLSPYVTQHLVRFGLYQVDHTRPPNPLTYGVSIPNPERRLLHK